MRLSYRLNLSLIAGIVVTSLAFTLYQTVVETRGLRADAQRNAKFLADGLEKPAAAMLERDATSELLKLVDQLATNSGKTAAAIYDISGENLAVTSTFPTPLPSALGPVQDALEEGVERSDFTTIGGHSIHLLAVPLRSDSGVVGALAVLQDVGYIDAQAVAVWKRSMLHMLVQTFFIVGITMLIIRLNLSKPLGHMAQWLKDMRTGRATEIPDLTSEKALEPITAEVTRMAASLKVARRAAEEEARLRDAAESRWTLERLRVHVQGKLAGSRLFVISNREPYEHFMTQDKVGYKVPASGLVTALDPVLAACGGTWIAQGTGAADRMTVDAFDRVAVPPDNPKYSLRRVWLTEEEEQGFYFGFSNEGIWPLCHIAHTRPTFRSEDWQHYREINHRFADAFLEEAAGEKNPIVLVQDYHFALLPRMIKERIPGARVAIFWHIPWPNAEAFSICPWQHELLDGLLGADLIGFHIQSHCNNFLETVDRAIECRIERERYGVNRLGHFTSVRPFPISVSGSPPAKQEEFSYETRASLLRGLGVEAPSFGIGVDRIDYTKGIPERFRGVERFFELNPSYRKQFTFVQIGAPSRSHIRRYQELEIEVEQEAERINRRFQNGSWKPIVLVKRQHSHQEILPYYRAASMCLVTSLHDGMNLVAKEFVAAREDDGGVLVLSRFAGASHELSDALTVNPYDTGQIARAIRESLEMLPDERIDRMRRMRTIVRENNVYRWAGNLLSELCEIRLPVTANGGSSNAPEPQAVFAAKL
jgi:trehalose-6-phosphate synthase